MKKIRSKAEALAVLKQARGLAGNTEEDLFNLMFDKQKGFVLDECRWKAACCSRRGGKTWMVGAYLLYTAFKYPKSNCLYLARSRTRAKAIVAKDVFGEIIEKLHLEEEVRFVNGEYVLRNGSRIGVAGADADKRQISNVVGSKYKLVCLDEAQYWSSHLWTIIYEGLRNAMQDQMGSIVAIGVPTAAHGFFYDVTTRQVDPETGAVKYPAWSIHEWHALDNPHQREAYLADIEELKKTDPGFMLTPTFKQTYLGQWEDDPDARCYGFTEQNNRAAAVPGYDPLEPDKRAWMSDYEWVCGVDVGFFPDPMAFVVMCHRKDRSDQHLYVLHSYKKLKMSIDDVEAYRRELEKRWPISQYVIDGANSNVFNELQKRFDMPLQKATKMEKAKFIGLFNDDIVSGKVKLVGSGAESLAKEWVDLTWKDGKASKLTEDPACQNHLCDAALYGWRSSYHYQKATPKPVVVDRTLEEQAKAEEQMLARRARGDDDPLARLYDGFRPQILDVFTPQNQEW